VAGTHPTDNVVINKRERILKTGAQRTANASYLKAQIPADRAWPFAISVVAAFFIDILQIILRTS
jgi:hypothetical protein